MAKLLFLEDCYEAQRKFFKLSEMDKAISLLKKWVLDNESREVFLYEIGSDVERQINSGFDLLRSDFTFFNVKKRKYIHKGSIYSKPYHGDGYEGDGIMEDDFDKDGKMINV